MLRASLILSTWILLLQTRHVWLAEALSFVREDLALVGIVSTIPRGGGGGPFGNNDDLPRPLLRSRAGLPPPTNPLAPIYKVQQQADQVKFIFDLPKDVKVSDLDIAVNHKRKVLHVKGRRSGLLSSSSRASTKLDQEIPLDEDLLNLHSGRVQFGAGQVSITFSKSSKMEKLRIEHLNSSDDA